MEQSLVCPSLPGYYVVIKRRENNGELMIDVIPKRGANPGVTLTKQDLRELLKTMDEAESR